MSRPSTNTDKRMIAAAKALIPQTGFKGLKIRDVAKKSGVNLGMFNYHFKTKEKFLEIVMSEIYGEFMNKLQLSSQAGNTSKERLSNALNSLGLFIRDHRELVLPLVEEIISGNRRIMEFAKRHMSKHISILLSLIRDCQKENFIRKDMPPFLILISLIVPMAAPNIMAKVIEKYYSITLFNIFAGPLQSVFLSDKSVSQRVGIVLKGVSPGN